MALYRVTVRKDITFDVRATTEDYARALAISRADGTLPSQMHDFAKFVEKRLTVESVEEVTR